MDPVQIVKMLRKEIRILEQFKPKWAHDPDTVHWLDEQIEYRRDGIAKIGRDEGIKV